MEERDSDLRLALQFPDASAKNPTRKRFEGDTYAPLVTL